MRAAPRHGSSPADSRLRDIGRRDRLRAENPWNLPLTGPWRFRLTHGSAVAGRFVPGAADVNGIEATSSRGR